MKEAGMPLPLVIKDVNDVFWYVRIERFHMTS